MIIKRERNLLKSVFALLLMFAVLFIIIEIAYYKINDKFLFFEKNNLLKIFK